MYEHFYPRILTRQNSANVVKYSVSRIYARFGGVAVHVEVVVSLSKNFAKPQEYVQIGIDAEDYYRIKDSEKEE